MDVSREKTVASSDICRTCLRVGDLIDIAEEVHEETPILVLLEKYISPEFYLTTKCICRSCADEFVSINRFIEKCKRSVLLCASFKDGKRKNEKEATAGDVLLCDEERFDDAVETTDGEEEKGADDALCGERFDNTVETTDDEEKGADDAGDVLLCDEKRFDNTLEISDDEEDKGADNLSCRCTSNPKFIQEEKIVQITGDRKHSVGNRIPCLEDKVFTRMSNFDAVNDAILKKTSAASKSTRSKESYKHQIRNVEKKVTNESLRSKKIDHGGERRPSNAIGGERPSNANAEGGPSNAKGEGRPSNTYGEERPSNGNSERRPSNGNSGRRPSNADGGERPSNANGGERPSNARMAESMSNLDAVDEALLKKTSADSKITRWKKSYKDQIRNVEKKVTNESLKSKKIEHGGERRPSNANAAERPSNANGEERPSNANAEGKPSNANAEGRPSNAKGEEKPSNTYGEERLSDGNSEGRLSNANGEDKVNRSNKTCRKKANLLLKKIGRGSDGNFAIKSNESREGKLDGSNKSSRRNRKKSQPLRNDNSPASIQRKFRLKPLESGTRKHRFNSVKNSQANKEMVLDDETEGNSKKDNNFRKEVNSKFGLYEPKDFDDRRLNESSADLHEKNLKVTNKFRSTKTKNSTDKNQRLHELNTATTRSRTANEEVKSNNQVNSPKQQNFLPKQKPKSKHNTNSINSVQISTEVIETKREIIEETQSSGFKKLTIAERTRTTEDWLIQSVHKKTTRSEAYVSEDFRRTSSSSGEDGDGKGRRRVTSTSTYRSEDVEDFDRLSVARSDFNIGAPRTGYEYKCDYCPCSFLLVSSLAHHKKVHGITVISKPYLCEYCGETFMNFSKFRIHRKDHTLEQLYVCLYCEKIVRGPLIHNNHLRYHTVEQGELSSIDKLDVIEKLEIRGKFVCVLCGKLFANRKVLQTHLFWHPDEAKLFGCSYCDKTFTQKRSLRNHEYLHKGEGTGGGNKGKPNTC